MGELEDQESQPDQGQAGEEEFQERAHGGKPCGRGQFGISWTDNRNFLAESLPALASLFPEVP